MSDQTPALPHSAAARGVLSSSEGAKRLQPPRTLWLLAWLTRSGVARYRFRLLQGAALSLAINQCALLWLGEATGAKVKVLAPLLAATTHWTMGLALVAGWVLLGGWFDEPTRALVEQLAQRRGYSTVVSRQLETMAAWRWLSMLLAFPCVALALVALGRISTLPELWALVLNLLLCLLLTQLAAACVLVLVVSMARLEPRVARWVWFGACFLPELIRPLMPGFPTIRRLIFALSQVVLRWGAIG